MSADPNCIFCKIIEKKTPASVVHEDEHAIAFEDVNPQAPVHTLIVPKKHIPDIHSITVADRELVGHLFLLRGKSPPRKALKRTATGWSLTTVPAPARPCSTSIFIFSGRAFHWPPG